MPKTRPAHAPAFRRQLVEWVRADRDPTDLACECELAIRNGTAEADRSQGRRENRPLRLERDLQIRFSEASAGRDANLP